MTIKVNDIDKTEAWSADVMLPPGEHHVRIESAEEGTSTNGYDQVELRFAAENGTGSIRDWLVFTPATLGKARALLDAAGIEPQSGEWEFPTAQLPERKLNIVVAEEPDRNDATKMRRRVMGYKPAAPSTTNGAGGEAAGGDDIPF